MQTADELALGACWLQKQLSQLGCGWSCQVPSVWVLAHAGFM